MSTAYTSNRNCRTIVNAKSPFGSSTIRHVAELDRVAEVRQRVLVAPLPFDLAGALQEQRRLADEVERDVGERDVLLEDRRVPAPLGQPVAQHEPVVAEPQQILEIVVRRRWRASHRRRRHRPRTPRGTL